MRKIYKVKGILKGMFKKKEEKKSVLEYFTLELHLNQEYINLYYSEEKLMQEELNRINKAILENKPINIKNMVINPHREVEYNILKPREIVWIEKSKLGVEDEEEG